MGIISGVSDVVGLHLASSYLNLVQLSQGSLHNLVRFGSVPLDKKVAISDAELDQRKTAEAIKSLIHKTKPTTNNVSVSLPSSKTFSTIIDVDTLPEKDLRKSLMIQIESYIPTAADESEVDFAVLGVSPLDPAKSEVLITSVSKPYVESRLEMIESAGLNVVAMEPEVFTLCRSLLPNNPLGSHMLIDMRDFTTDIAITKEGKPRLVRSVSVGLDSLVKSISTNLNLDEQQSSQFLFKFGMSSTKLEGQIAGAVASSLDILVSEIQKSIKYYSNRYSIQKLDRIIVTGYVSAIPELPNYIANKSSTSVEIGNAWRNVSIPPNKKDELLSVSNHFAVAVGLAGRDL
jgi:type IV pilus assembly protein PilM